MYILSSRRSSRLPDLRGALAPKMAVPTPHQRCAFFNRDRKIVGHAHGKFVERERRVAFGKRVPQQAQAVKIRANLFQILGKGWNCHEAAHVKIFQLRQAFQQLPSSGVSGMSPCLDASGLSLISIETGKRLPASAAA